MNKLKNQRSSYLLQHADNPVNWFPWCDEAFTLAKKENKPILLSIGYSACHWCHVMAHESFEDESTAEMMNEKFVNIKLDKEERPDLDKIYQMSQAIITGKSGGWPLTVFMTAEKLPFFAGTYFPPVEKYGLPSFKAILERVSEFYETKSHDISAQNSQIQNIFRKLNENKDQSIEEDIMSKVIDRLETSLDKVHGGFGSAPKFPRCTNLNLFLLKNQTISSEAKSLVELTLDRMCLSGIYDHVDGGFFRYSVDELWMIPHFEKMLYDNGPMVSVLCAGYKVFHKELYLRKAIETCDWAIESMQSNAGGFFSTVDADSEGIEGKYYVWTDEELGEILDRKEYSLFNDVFKPYGKPNFENKCHLHVTTNKQNIFSGNKKEIDSILNKLKVARNKRIAPDTDRKILTSWNCLMIKGMLDVYKITNKEKYLDSALQSYNFIKKHLWKNGDLYACYHESEEFFGYIDDYAFLSEVCLELLKIRWDKDDYDFLNKLIQKSQDYFLDTENGGFYFSSSQNTDLFHRPKVFTDESMPSGNSIMISIFYQLYELTNDVQYKKLADTSFQSASSSINQSYESHCNILCANPDYHSRRLIIIKTLPESIEEIRAMVLPKSKTNDDVFILNKNTKTTLCNIDNKISESNFAAFICQGFVCAEPILNINDLLREIEK